MRDGDTYDFRTSTPATSREARPVRRRRSLVRHVRFPYAAYEDAELAYRLWRQRGLRIVYHEAPRAAHYHYYGARSFATRQYLLRGDGRLQLPAKHPSCPPAWRPDRVAACERWRARPRRRCGRRRGCQRAGRLEDCVLAVAGTCEAIQAPSSTGCTWRCFEYFVVKGMVDVHSNPRWPTPCAVPRPRSLPHEISRLRGRLRQALPVPSDEVLLSLFAGCDQAQRLLRTTRVLEGRDARVPAEPQDERLIVSPSALGRARPGVPPKPEDGSPEPAPPSPQLAHGDSGYRE